MAYELELLLVARGVEVAHEGATAGRVNAVLATEDHERRSPGFVHVALGEPGGLHHDDLGVLRVNVEIDVELLDLRGQRPADLEAQK